jgi:heat shock protein HslJ
MSTDPNLDELMDARLHSAGQRWRDGHIAVAQPDPAGELVDVHADSALDRRRPRRVYWLAAASAAAVVAVVAGVLLAVGLGNSPKHQSAAGSPSGAPTNQPGPITGGPPPAIVGRTWYLSSYAVSGTPSGTGDFVLRVAANGQLTAGPDGCPTVIATAAVTSHRLTIAHIGLPAACQPSGGHMSLEPELGRKALSQIDQLLRGSLTWSVVAGRPEALKLSKPGGVLTFLSVQPIVANEAVMSGTWRLSGFRDTGVEQGVAQRERLTIRNGRLSAGISCNTLTAQVTVQHDTLVLTDVHSTTLPCPSPPNQAASDQENTLYTVLTGTVHWSVSNGHLSIVKNSRNALSYRR